MTTGAALFLSISSYIYSPEAEMNFKINISAGGGEEIFYLCGRKIKKQS